MLQEDGAAASPLLSLALATAHRLADMCRPVRFARSSHTRHTHIQRCLTRIALPLRSLSARLERGLVSAPLSDQPSYTAFALSTLRRFESDLLRLFRSLGNRARATPALAALVEHTTHAVALVDERERALILNALCSA